MRLPFLQVSQEEMARARTLAGYLGVPYAHALGMTVALKAAALEAAPEDDVSGAITDPNAAEWIAVQCGWPLDRADALAVALVRCGFAIAGPQGGHSVAGMEPYAKALDTSEKRSEAGRRGALARKEKGGYGRAMAGPQQSYGQGVASDAKTQTQTQTQKETSASQSAAVAPLAPEDLPDATEAAEEVHEDRPALVLEAQVSAKPGRRASAGEALYTRIESIREAECKAHGLPYVPSRWAYSRQNRDLGPIANLPDGHEEKERFEAAWGAFLADSTTRELDEPLSLSFFWKMRSRYEGKALRDAGGGP